MLIIPAIDLLGGRAVRLEQGDFARVTDCLPDPIELAYRFVAAGARWLHVVDLDGARSGRWRHLDVIAEIVAAAGVPVQAGGGARDLCTIPELHTLAHRWEVAKLLDQGVHYADIAARTGASTATITRINSWRRFGMGGYRLLLDRRKARSK